MPEQLKDQSIQKLLNLAKESRRKSDLSSAIAYYQEALLIEPDKAYIYVELGNIFNQQERSHQAIKAYQRALELAPEQPPWTYQGLAKAYKKLQQYSEAIAAWRQAIEVDPYPAAWVYLGLGDTLFEQQLYPEAIAAWRQAIKVDPHPPVWMYNKLANALLKQKLYAKAIATYLELIELDPSSGSINYVKIGDIYNLQNQFFAAKAAYQAADTARAVFNLNEIIAFVRQYFTVDPNYLDIDILDNGCDHTGKQLALLAEHTKGRVVGTNVYQGFPKATVKRCRQNNEFYQMDGQNLTFDNCSFDLVISLNVLEHVPNPVKYLQECYRVMRPGGFGYFSWYPLWSGATGHHVHPDMVSRAAQRLGLTPPIYSLDGTSIPFWGHLLFSPEQMLHFLTTEKNYDPALAEWIQHYTYHNDDLNRWFWRDIWHSFQNLAWKIVEVNRRGEIKMDAKTFKLLEQKYGMVEDFEICGATIVVQKLSDLNI